MKLFATLLVSGLLLTGCDSKDTAAAAATAEATAEPAAEAAAKPAAEGGAHAMAMVPKEGKEYDPAIKAADVPAGAWYCDMNGSVHYARGEEGDAKCPVCSMKLVHKGDAPAAHGEHAGHE